MIRDMELLLNTVYDEDIKLYLKEALLCYSTEAYRACIIMALIGGIHDLHNKLRNLSSSNSDIAELEKNVSELKNSLKPYERALIDGCAKPNIDLLSASDAKELHRCFDIRNDCAHPSDYTCTAETARYVFSRIIDILASKPILLGQQHINSLINNISSDTFFPRIDKNEIQYFVNKQLNLYSTRIVKPLAQKLTNLIISDSMATNKNKQFFLANMVNKLGYDFDNIISPLFIDSKYCNDIMYMISANMDIVDSLSDENIKRLLCIFKTYVVEDHGYNQTIIDILQSPRLSETVFDNDIADILNMNYQNMSDNQCYIWITFFSSNSISKQRMQLIKNEYSNHINVFSKFASQDYQKIFVLCDNPMLYSALINDISLRVANSDFTISNPAVADLNELGEEFIDMLNENEIKVVIYSIFQGQQGYGRNVKDLLNEISNNYFYKLYIKQVIPNYNLNDLEEMLKYKLHDSTFEKFVEIINAEDPSFKNHFVQIAEEYVNKNFCEDTFDWNHVVLKNAIRSLKNKETDVL